MSTETAPLQPKPLIFIDEASADPNRFGFPKMLFHPNYRVYITSPRVDETRERLHGLVDSHQILPVNTIQSHELLKQGTEYRPVIEVLSRSKLGIGGAIKEKVSTLMSQTKTPSGKPLDSLLIFGRLAARPLDMKGAVFVMEDPQRPTHYDLVIKIADVLRTKSITKEVRSVFEGWQQYGVGESFIKEIRDFIHTFEQCAKNSRGEIICVPTLEIRNPHLAVIRSADVPTRATEPTPA